MPAWLPLVILLAAITILVFAGFAIGKIVVELQEVINSVRNKHVYDKFDGDLPPIGWWAKCTYTNEYHRICSHNRLVYPTEALTCGLDGYWGADGNHWIDWRESPPKGYSNEYWNIQE